MRRGVLKAVRRRRPGYTLVSFAMSIFVVMGLAALVIDVGIVRLTQKQIQTAVDSAAMEGLRGRDRDDLTNPDQSRRKAASDLVAWTFDDDLDVSADSRNFGAGPVLSLTGGVGDPRINASQLLAIPGTPVYKPVDSSAAPGLELNTANERHGDMVAGDYLSTEAHQESADYARADFDPSATDPDAFLVRMRRSNNFGGLDSNPGISSSGPAIPFLFGRGALLPAADPGAGYSPRHHGLTVRGAGIAQARRALSVGAASSADDLPGGVSFAFGVADWQSLADGVSNMLEVDASGQIRQLTGQTSTPKGIVVVADGSSQTWSLGQSAEQVGLLASPSEYVATALANAAMVGSSRQGYVPILGDSGTIADRIVGFGFAELSEGGNPGQWVLTKRNSHVAHENASPAVIEPVDSQMATELFDVNVSLGDDSLFAAALVR